MPRVTCGVARHRRKKRLLKKTKGYRGARRNLFRSARETLHRAQRYAFRDRKARKRDFRRLWITRISAALMPYHLNYSQFMGAMNKAKVALNRKIIAGMALSDLKGFERLVEIARQHLPHQTLPGN